MTAKEENRPRKEPASQVANVNTEPSQLDNDEPQPLSEFLRIPIQCSTGFSSIEEEVAAEDAEEEVWDNEAWNAYRNQVVRNWNEADQKEIDFAKKVRLILSEVKETFKDEKTHAEKLTRKKITYSQLFRAEEVVDGVRPGIKSLKDFRKSVSSKPPRKQIIEGILKRKSKMLISSASKVGKTWVLLNIGLSVASGCDWLGFKCNKGRVLYCNFELHDDTLNERFSLLFEQLGENDDNFDVLQLRGHSNSADEIATMIIEECEGRQYDLIIVDPTYKMLGDLDENAAGDMNKLFNEFERIAQKIGAAIAIVGHFAKGSSAHKQSGDRTSGSGVFQREPDAIVELVPATGQEDLPNPDIDVHFRLREFPYQPAFVAKIDNFVLRRIDGNVTTGVAANSKLKMTPEQYLSLVTPQSIRRITVSDWDDLAKDKYDVKPRTCKEARSDLRKRGLIKWVELGVVSHAGNPIKIQHWEMTEAGEKLINSQLKQGECI